MGALWGGGDVGMWGCGQGRTGSTLGPRATIVVGAPHSTVPCSVVGPLKWWAPGPCPIAHMASPPLVVGMWGCGGGHI